RRCAKNPPTSIVQTPNSAQPAQTCSCNGPHDATTHRESQMQKTFRPVAARDGIPERRNPAAPANADGAAPAPPQPTKMNDPEIAKLPRRPARPLPANLYPGVFPPDAIQSPDRTPDWSLALPAATTPQSSHRGRRPLPARGRPADTRKRSTAAACVR